MNEWGYYRMVRLEEPKTLKEMDEEEQQKFNRLKETVSKYKYAIMDEDDEMVDWFETHDEAETHLNQVMKGCDNEWEWYIKEVTDEMREKVINS